MKITELIELLQTGRRAFGDIQMDIYDSNGERISTKSIDTGCRQKGSATTVFGYFSDLEGGE